MMEKLAEGQISQEDVRKWLSRVVQLESKKIERLKMLRRFDSRDPNDDLCHDEATRTAWQHIATEGLNAPLPEDLTNNDVVSLYVDIFRGDLKSDTRTRIIVRDFQELTGHHSISADQIITLKNLIIEGKAAAWRRHDRILSPIGVAADQMLDNDYGLLGPGAAALPPRALTPHEQHPHTPHASVPVAATALIVKPTSNDEHDPIDLPQAEEQAFDPSIAKVVQRMNEIKRTEKIEEKNLRQYESFATLFTLLTGITDVRLIRQPDVKKFRADLSNIPKSWGKSPSDRLATREQMMTRAEELPPEKRGLAVGTVNRHLEHLAQIIDAARDEGFDLDRRLNPAKLRLKDTVRDRDRKEAFSQTQLLEIFKSNVWTGSYSERYQTRKGPTVYKNGIYWCPIIGAYIRGTTRRNSGPYPI